MPGGLTWQAGTSERTLMHRSVRFDVLACPRCGGRLRLIALLGDPSVVERFLRHLGLSTAIPDARPARPPPLPLDGLARRGSHQDTLVDPGC